MFAKLAISQDSTKYIYILNYPKPYMHVNNLSHTDCLYRAKLKQPDAHEAAVMGRRYTGAEAKDYGIVHVTSSAETVLSSAIHVAKQLVSHGGYDKETIQIIKNKAYREVLSAPMLGELKAPAGNLPKL